MRLANAAAGKNIRNAADNKHLRDIFAAIVVINRSLGPEDHPFIRAPHTKAMSAHTQSSGPGPLTIRQ